MPDRGYPREGAGMPNPSKENAGEPKDQGFACRVLAHTVAKAHRAAKE
jgi:hypothetical protein